MVKLVPPCSYQGGKQRIAVDIVSKLFEENEVDEETVFYDLCSGSGAISIELINRGIKPKNIKMLDASEWGLFYKQVGEGSFDLDVFKLYIDDIPKDITKIQQHIQDLYKQDANVDTAYKFLILQAASFGSKAIWRKDQNNWCTSSFRNYW